MLLGSLSVVAAAVAARYFWGAEPANANPAQRASTRKAPVRAGTTPARPRSSSKGAPAPKSRSKIRVVAVVNGQKITREDLARECLRHYGKQVLQRLVNKWLIAQECMRRDIAVTRGEVDAEIERMAKRFGLSVERWLKMLEQERGIEPSQYADDIIWPTLALRKLAGQRLQVSRDELVKAYQTQFGPMVQARLISCKERDKAKKVHAAAVANPGDFGDLAKEYSEDVNSRSVKGLIQPIRKHGSYKEIEEAVFNMEDGDVSPVIHVAGQYVILKRERLIEGSEIEFDKAVPRLEEMIREQKLRTVASDVFQKLQDRAKVVNVFNDPEKRRAMPGVAAVINDKKITVRELAEACIKRHGKEALDGTINRTLLKQACAKRKITITEKDLDREITRAAATAVELKPDGSPDVEAWLALVTKQQGISVDIYRHDSVWPSVALKKLVGDKVQVTEEDLNKGFEANYGPRVRCRAIVLDDLRRAQQVWEMARSNPSKEYFGKLAKQYSIEPGSAALEGEMPPIQKNGGQPVLEKEAFGLAKGELSGIIQVEDKFVILLCEGRTKPVEVDRAEVRDLIYDDIREKKLRLAMARHFRQLQQDATIDNYLTGTSHSPPRKSSSMRSAVEVPTLRQVPGTR